MSDSEQLGSFTTVDEHPEPATFIDLLDRQAQMPGIVALRRNVLGLLDVRRGMRVLDVGCGTGEVARSIAEAGASVVAIDASENMLAEALRRTPDGLPVEFVVGDAQKIDVGDAEFDAAHSERTLQHVPDPQAAVDELIRAVKPGGRIVIADTDWTTATVDLDGPGDLVRRFNAANEDSFASSTIGRRLYRMFKLAGLRDVAVEGHAIVFAGSAVAPILQRALTLSLVEMTEEGRITAEEAALLTGQIVERLGDDTFFASTTMFVVSGTKP